MKQALKQIVLSCSFDIIDLHVLLMCLFCSFSISLCFIDSDPRFVLCVVNAIPYMKTRSTRVVKYLCSGLFTFVSLNLCVYIAYTDFS